MRFRGYRPLPVPLVAADSNSCVCLANPAICAGAKPYWLALTFAPRSPSLHPHCNQCLLARAGSAIINACQPSSKSLQRFFIADAQRRVEQHKIADQFAAEEMCVENRIVQC